MFQLLFVVVCSQTWNKLQIVPDLKSYLLYETELSQLFEVPSFSKPQNILNLSSCQPVKRCSKKVNHFELPLGFDQRMSIMQHCN